MINVLQQLVPSSTIWFCPTTCQNPKILCNLFRYQTKKAARFHVVLCLCSSAWKMSTTEAMSRWACWFSVYQPGTRPDNCQLTIVRLTEHMFNSSNQTNENKWKRRSPGNLALSHWKVLRGTSCTWSVNRCWQPVSIFVATAEESAPLYWHQGGHAELVDPTYKSNTAKKSSRNVTS